MPHTKGGLISTFCLAETAKKQTSGFFKMAARGIDLGSQNSNLIYKRHFLTLCKIFIILENLFLQKKCA